MTGWVKLHRKLLDWEWYDDINVRILWLHLLLKANHKDKKWHGLIIRRGQLVTGRKELSEETGLSERAVRTALTKLKTTSSLTIKSTKLGSILTIENYEEYQTTPEEATKETTTDASGKRPDNDQITTNTKEYKKERIEEERKKEPLPLKASTQKLPLPDWLPVGAWDAFLEMRAKRKRYPTERAMQMLLIKLHELRKQNYDVQEVIEQSVMHNWLGFFEVKINGKPKYRNDLHPEPVDYRDTEDYKSMYGDQ